jgi:hypothetical protein
MSSYDYSLQTSPLALLPAIPRSTPSERLKIGQLAAVVSYRRGLQTTPRLAAAFPVGVNLISGSAVRLPTKVMVARS